MLSKKKIELRKYFKLYKILHIMVLLKAVLDMATPSVPPIIDSAHAQLRERRPHHAAQPCDRSFYWWSDVAKLNYFV